MSDPVKVTVTGAAGNIGYALVFRIAAGEMLGKDVPIELQLLEIPPAMDALNGVVMELDDCAFPLLKKIVATDQVDEAFQGSDVALLVGSRPRGPGMERKDLLEANGAIFTVQGKALSDHANPDVKVLVVGNPANTNCFIALNSAPNLSASNFTAMTRLDANRAVAQVAQKTGSAVDEIENLVIWGNHSATMFPNLYEARVGGRNAMDIVDQSWYEDEFVPAIQQRGAAIINARGSSSAASAANAAVEHVNDWVHGTTAVTSMGIESDGQYGITKGLIFSYPVRVIDGEVRVEPNIELDDFCLEKIRATEQELIEERDAVLPLLENA